MESAKKEPAWVTRFSAKIHLSGSCWLWTAYTMRRGYGRFGHAGKIYLAHRAVYEGMVGEIPPGLELDHLCRNRNCVNPLHLEPVTRKENVRRGLAGKHTSHLVGDNNPQGAKTHCPAGHVYSADNTYIAKTKKGGINRQCILCRNEKCRKWYLSHREVKNPRVF
jgi:hypothetical protein